jgi:hypothetical protein
MLKGDRMDESCRKSKNGFYPVIYLTAYSDDMVLDRAKVTEPYDNVKPLSYRSAFQYRDGTEACMQSTDNERDSCEGKHSSISVLILVSL